MIKILLLALAFFTLFSEEDPRVRIHGTYKDGKIHCSVLNNGNEDIWLKIPIRIEGKLTTDVIDEEGKALVLEGPYKEQNPINFLKSKRLSQYVLLRGRDYTKQRKKGHYRDDQVYQFQRTPIIMMGKVVECSVSAELQYVFPKDMPKPKTIKAQDKKAAEK